MKNTSMKLACMTLTLSLLLSVAGMVTASNNANTNAIPFSQWAQNFINPLDKGVEPNEDDSDSSAFEVMTDNEVFALIAGRTFNFLSGVGGWWTDIEISADGSFTGYFHDSDMGDTDDDYPEGTLYECYFSGMFILAETIDPYTYKLRLTALNIESEPDAERIVNGVRVINADAYGMEGGETFMLYLPGRTTADLPDGFLEWICMPNAWEEAPETLPFYGLYNIEEETGFFS